MLSATRLLDPPWGEDQEFFAVQVENLYRSEKGLKKIRRSHDDPPVWWSDTQNLLDHTEFSPPVWILLGRFKGFIPGVFDKLADIPQAKATYNPFRKYKEEEQAKAKATPPSP